MPSSETISAFALVISVTSLGLSAYVALRDRGRVRTKSTFYAAFEDRPASMRVEAVNIGRRPVILTLFGGYYEDGHWRGTYISGYKTGVRLGENDRFSEDIDEQHHMLFDHETGSAVTDLWFEDTLGRRYPVKGAKKHLKRFFERNAV
jgi:hypothetical protein